MDDKSRVDKVVMESIQMQSVMPLQNEEALAEKNTDAKGEQAKSYKVKSTIILKWILLLSIVLLVSYLSLPLLPVVIIWFLPTIISFFLDSAEHKSFTKNMFCFNFLGIAPSVCFLLKYGNISDSAVKALMESSILFYIYAIISIGIVIYLILPRYVMSLENFKLLQKMRDTEEELNTLREEWNFK